MARFIHLLRYSVVHISRKSYVATLSIPGYRPPTPYAELCKFGPCLESLQLDIVVKQSHILTRFERRETNVWASVAPERIAQCAVSTTANLSLHCEVHFGEVIGVQL